MGGNKVWCNFNVRLIKNVNTHFYIDNCVYISVHVSTYADIIPEWGLLHSVEIDSNGIEEHRFGDLAVVWAHIGAVFHTITIIVRGTCISLAITCK